MTSKLVISPAQIALALMKIQAFDMGREDVKRGLLPSFVPSHPELQDAYKEGVEYGKVEAQTNQSSTEEISQNYKRVRRTNRLR